MAHWVRSLSLEISHYSGVYLWKLATKNEKKKVIKNYIKEERFKNTYIVNGQGENAMWKGNKPI